MSRSFLARFADVLLKSLCYRKIPNDTYFMCARLSALQESGFYDVFANNMQLEHEQERSNSECPH